MVMVLNGFIITHKSLTRHSFYRAACNADAV